MGTFDASLRTIGDTKALPATIRLDEGRLSIASGDTEIGSWALSEIHLEPIPTGYRMAAEGDSVILEIKDLTGFNTALEQSTKRRVKVPRLKKEQAAPKTQVEAQVETPVRAAAAAPAEPSNRAVALPPREETAPEPKKKKEAGTGSRIVDFVDGFLVKAQKKLGPYLPDWVFTRIVFWGLAAAIILMFVLPGLISILLLVCGLLIVLFGAVVYTDPMLASRMLPGRTAPQHALLVGVLTLMMGVLLGVIAR